MVLALLNQTDTLIIKSLLTALKDINIKDIRLEIPFSEKIAEYMMGMGLPGTIVPQDTSIRLERAP